MDGLVTRAYKRTCFQGRGALARWLDRAFFSALGGLCLLIYCKLAWLALLFGLFLLALGCFIGKRRWETYRERLYRQAAQALRREAWMKEAGERIRVQGGVILYPTPDRETLKGACLLRGGGTNFHCFGNPDQALTEETEKLGCSLTFHPWGEGREPTPDEVETRLKLQAPQPRRGLWKTAVTLPGSRYYLAGGVLLLLSMVLRRALYWRLLGSLCLILGTGRRAFSSLRSA